MSAKITRTKNVDGNGNVSYRIERGGEHLGDVLKTGSASYRPELPSGDFGPNASITRGIDWLVRVGGAR